MLAEKTLKKFLEETASKAPVPGGGSIAAMSGATAYALTEMVANLTIGKKGYEEVSEEMCRIKDSVSKLREELLHDIDRDAASFDDVMKAFKMPKETDEEKQIRREAIQKGYKKAALVPLEVSEKILESMEIIIKAVECGNKNAVTDAIVAVMMARTAILSALFNVKINIGSIKDEKFVEEIKKKIASIENNAIEFEKKVLNSIEL